MKKILKEEFFIVDEEICRFLKESKQIHSNNNSKSSSARSIVKEQGGDATIFLSEILHENSNYLLENSMPSHREDDDDWNYSILGDPAQD